MSSSSSSKSTSSQTIDNEKLQQFMGKILSDFGGAAIAVLVYIGDKLGLYKAMYDFGKFVISKALGTISITHQGIKEIEELLEDTRRHSYTLESTEFLHSIGEAEKSNILEIQKLGYNVLKLTYDRLSNQKIRAVNLFEIGEALGIEKEKLERIYFYLEDEGLIESVALGGAFSITNKGKKLIEKGNINRIF